MQLLLCTTKFVVDINSIASSCLEIRGKWKVTILLLKWRGKVMIAVSISAVCVGMLLLDTGKQSFPDEE